MKLTESKYKDGVVRGRSTLKFDMDPQELDELLKALLVVRKYESIARKEFKKEKGYDPTTSDWCMIDFMPGSNDVTVFIEDGMAG